MQPHSRQWMFCVTSLIVALVSFQTTLWAQVAPPNIDIYVKQVCSAKIAGTSLYNCQDGSSPVLYDSTVDVAIQNVPGSSVPLVPASPTQQTRYSWFSLTPSSRWGFGGNSLFGSWYPSGDMTVEMKVIAPTIPKADPQAPYTSLLNFYDENGVTLVSIGKRGSDWTFGRRVNGSTNLGYWMTPWEPIDYYSQQTHVYEDVFYTFLPDGRLQIDLFTPSQNGSGSPSYLWQESIQDGGWPVSTLGGDGKSLNFLPAKGYAALGQESCAGCAPSIYPAGTVPAADTEQVQEVLIWLNALTKDQIVARATGGFGGQPPPPGTLPCNTGMWLTTSVNTPCGSGAPASPVPPPPPTVSSIPAALPHVPSDIYADPYFDNNGDGNFVYDHITWSAPLNPPDQGYRVDLDCLPSLGTTTTSIAVDIQQIIPSGCNIFVTALYSNSPYSDVTANYNMRSYSAIRFSTNTLTFSGPGSQSMTVSNQGNASPTFQTYLFSQTQGVFSSDESGCANPLPAGASCNVTLSYNGSQQVNDVYRWKYGPGPGSGSYSTGVLVQGNTIFVRSK